MSGQRTALLVGLSILVVSAAIAVGIRIIGPPADAREVRLDDARVQALEAVSRAIDEYHRRHDRLPPDLAALGGFSNVRTTDPETGEPFAYRITSGTQYELCATFLRRTPAEQGTTYWWHDAGRQCYALAPRESHGR